MSKQGLIAKAFRYKLLLSKQFGDFGLNKLVSRQNAGRLSILQSVLPKTKDFSLNKKSISFNYCRLFSTSGKRFDSSNSQGDRDDKTPDKTPNLMDIGGPEIWPNLFLTIKNWFITKVIIQPYFDPDFNLKDFVQGTKQAMVYVSSQLASGTFSALEGLITPEALAEIKKNYTHFTLAQRQRLEIKKEDIYFTFPYQIGIILDDDSSKRHAEILVVFHCIYDLDSVKNIQNITETTGYEDRVTICNYRFRREFTKGVNGEWIINQLNHFKASDMKNN